MEAFNFPLYILQHQKEGFAALLLLAILFSVLFVITVYKAKRNAKLCANLERENFKLKTILEQERLFASEKNTFYTSAHEEMSDQFSAIAERVLDKKGGKLNEENSARIGAILHPLKEQLISFKSDINEIHHKDTKERAYLRQEIIQLRNLNEQINKEAANLTNALRGDNKTQGIWGELVLERVLEASGLQKDREYSTQNSFKDDDNQLYRPDALIHLPGGRSIIIDAKVSLTSWERFVNESDDDIQSKYLQEHILSVKNHIGGLSSKSYQELPGLDCLDFVLLFMPIEAASSAVFRSSPSLYEEALKKQIIVVTPQTLLATVKTIASLWQREKQSKNSQEIAERATILYDKFRLFSEDLEKLGNQLTTSITTYETTMRRLSQGRGNLVSQAKKLTELGVRARKDLPDSIVKRAELDEEQDPDLPN